MKLEKGQISGLELRVMVMGFTLGSALVLPPARYAEHDAWIALAIGLVEALLIALVYVSLALRFQGKTFIEISDTVFGSLFGKVFSLLFLWFLLLIASLVVWDLTTFISLIMVQTPRWFFALTFILVAASAVRNGIEVIARCSQVLVPITVVSTLTTFTLLLKDADFRNLLPFLEVEPSKLFIAAHQSAVFPMAETVAFLMVIPFLNKSLEARTSILKGISFAGILLILITIRNTAVLGATAGLFTHPSFSAVRLINYGEFLTRMEILIALNFMMMGFVQVSILYYGTVLGTAQLLGLRSYLPVVLPIGSIILFMSLNEVTNFPEGEIFANKTALVHHPIFELGIPLFALIIAVIRKLPKGKT